MSIRTGYSSLQIALHWLIAILIVAAYILSDGMGGALRRRIEAGTTGLEGNTIHVWLGGAAFLLILIRIVVRLVRGAPAPADGTPPRLAQAAIWGHRALYALMILTPALGAAAWYAHLIDLGDVHALAGNALLILAAGHAAAAVWHQFVAKDGTLDRMRRPG